MHLKRGLTLACQHARQRVLHSLHPASVGAERQPAAVVLQGAGASARRADNPVHALVTLDDATGRRFRDQNAHGYGVDNSVEPGDGGAKNDPQGDAGPHHARANCGVIPAAAKGSAPP